MKIRIRPKHLHMASLIITAVSLGVSVNQQPANAGNPSLFGSGTDSAPAARTAVVAKSSKPKIRLVQVSPPEAGVQLLMGILQRIGNEPQIAQLQQKTLAFAKENEAPQIFAQNVDPANVIRPPSQALRRQSVAGGKVGNLQSDQLIAMMKKPQGVAGYYSVPAEKQESAANDMLARASNSPASPYTQAAATKSESRVAGRLDAKGDSFKKLSTSINKLYSATKFVEEITANKMPNSDTVYGDESDAVAADTESKVIRTGSRTTGSNISSVPKITEYAAGGASAGLAGAPMAEAKRERGMTIAAAAQPEIFDMRAKDRDSGADKNVTYMKPDQPGSYRTLKDWVGGSTLDSPADMNYRAKPSKAKAAAPSSTLATVAYIPPQLVSGIPGLRLGVTEGDLDGYLRGKGVVTRQKVNGWKVVSLMAADNGKTALQVYLRGGTVEAIRVFDQSYVPEGLGVRLSSELSKMKKKFGEAQFILDEPSAKAGEGPAAKNYVYPVNQISFQLARSNKNEPPTIQSLLMFQFL